MSKSYSFTIKTKSYKTFKLMFTNNLKIATYVFKKYMMGGKESNKSNKEEKRMKGAEREDKENVRRKKANIKGEGTFRIKKYIMPSSSSGPLHMQFLPPGKFLPSALLLFLIQGPYFGYSYLPFKSA